MDKKKASKFSFQNYLPSEPIRITLTSFRIFVLILIVLIGGFVINLRMENQNELEFLNEKHHEIELKISNYLHDMTQIEITSPQSDELEHKLKFYRDELKIIEKNINEIRSVWFMK